jgi:hypothetical protein
MYKVTTAYPKANQGSRRQEVPQKEKDYSKEEVIHSTRG